MGGAGLDVGLHRGARPDQTAEPLQLVGDELVVGRILQRQELQEEAMSLGWPVLAPVAAAGLRGEADALAEQSSPQFVEPGAAHPQMRGGSGGVERARVEVDEDAADKFEGMAVNQLLVFRAGTLPVQRIRDNAIAGSQPCWSPPLRSGLRQGCDHQIPPLLRLSVRFLTVSVRLCSGPDRRKFSELVAYAQQKTWMLVRLAVDLVTWSTNSHGDHFLISYTEGSKFVVQVDRADILRMGQVAEDARRIMQAAADHLCCSMPVSYSHHACALCIRTKQNHHYRMDADKGGLPNLCLDCVVSDLERAHSCRAHQIPTRNPFLSGTKDCGW